MLEKLLILSLLSQWKTIIMTTFQTRHCQYCLVSSFGDRSYQLMMIHLAHICSHPHISLLLNLDFLNKIFVVELLQRIVKTIWSAAGVLHFKVWLNIRGYVGETFCKGTVGWLYSNNGPEKRGGFGRNDKIDTTCQIQIVILQFKTDTSASTLGRLNFEYVALSSSWPCPVPVMFKLMRKEQLH